MTRPVQRLWSRARSEAWLARRESEGLDRFVLLHAARGPAAADDLHRLRFVETARRLHGLRHSVLETVDTIDPQTPAFTTSLVPGLNAAWVLDTLRRGGKEGLPLPVAVLAVARAAEGLAYAFDHGVRLDGLTAERITLGLPGTVHLYGMAEAAATAEAPAPPAAVLYGLGVTLLELLTGDATRLPAPGSLPAPVAEVARRALGTDAPYAHPRAVADALGGWLASDPQASRLDAKTLAAWLRKVGGKRPVAWEQVEDADEARATELLLRLLRPPRTAAPPPVEPPIAEEPAAAERPTEASEEPVVPAPEPPAEKKAQHPAQMADSPIVRGPLGTVTADHSEGFWLIEDDEEDEPLVPDADLDRVLAPLQAEQPTGDPASAPVCEVARVAGDAVVEIRVLHAGERFRPHRGPALLRMHREHAELALPKDASGTFIGHLGETRPLEPGSSRLTLGDRAEVVWDDVNYRFRLERGSRAAGKDTGIAVPWKLYLGALGAALGAHALLLLGLVGFADRMDLTVSRPEQKEVFASLQPPSKLPEAKPKPKPPPQARPKPKKRPPKVEKAAPAPDPTEARPAIPERVRKKLNQRIGARRRKAKDAAAALLDTLAEPAAAGPGLDVKEVSKAMDAVRGPGTGDALQVASNLGDAPGADLKLGGGGGTDVDTLGGAELKGKGAGRLEGRAKPGRVRGKVKTVRALTKVGCDVDRDAVRQAVTRNVGKIQACYERQLLRREGLSGKVHVEWGIDAKGKATNVRVRVSTLGDPKVVECVLGVIRKTRFPPVSGGQCTISWPFVFSPVR